MFGLSTLYVQDSTSVAVKSKIIRRRENRDALRLQIIFIKHVTLVASVLALVSAHQRLQGTSLQKLAEWPAAELVALFAASADIRCEVYAYCLYLW